MSANYESFIITQSLIDPHVDRRGIGEELQSFHSWAMDGRGESSHASLLPPVDITAREGEFDSSKLGFLPVRVVIENPAQRGL